MRLGITVGARGRHLSCAAKWGGNSQMFKAGEVVEHAIRKKAQFVGVQKSSGMNGWHTRVGAEVEGSQS